MGGWFHCVVIEGGSGGGGATLKVTCNERLAGGTIYCSLGTSYSYAALCPSVSPYVVNFNIPVEGTWVVSGTATDGSGVVFEDDIDITLGYNVSFTFSWQMWASEGGLDLDDYDTLDELLADEKAIRKLFTKHASVDYIAEQTVVNANLRKIIYDDYCAKWINNRDYAFDTMYANATIKAVMDEADKYGYGEWELVPQVPVMTSDTAPYGTAFADSESTTEAQKAWNAFSADPTTQAKKSSSSVGPSRIGYIFKEPIEIRGFLYAYKANTTINTRTITLQYSDDGSTWIDAYSNNYTTYQLGAFNSFTGNTPKVGSHRYWALQITLLTEAGTFQIYANQIQFYAWSSKGNVPIMTSNTTPYGTAFASTTYSSSYNAFNAFDDKINSYWCTTNGSKTNQYIGYKFVNPIKVKKVSITHSGNIGDGTGAIPKNCKVQYSNDNSTWTDVPNSNFIVTPQSTTPATIEKTIDIDVYALYWRVFILDNYGGSYINVSSVQFYGRTLSVSVPTMTSDTAPYGEAIASGVYSSYPAWKAFDGDDSTEFNSNNDDNSKWGGYDFKKPIKPYMAKILTGANHTTAISATIQGFNGDSWVDLKTISLPSGSNKTYIENIDSVSLYTKLRVFKNTNETRSLSIKTLQFYGLDYSEKEFEAGTTKKWLYDHGVELEEIVEQTAGSSAILWTVKGFGELYMHKGKNDTANVGSLAGFYSMVDVTNYNLLRMKVGNIAWADTATAAAANIAVWSDVPQTSATNRVANVNYVMGYGDFPNACGLDISSVTGEMYVAASMNSSGSSSASSGNAKKTTMTELWLE